MIPLLYSLPIDWSGEAQHNRTKGEIHNLARQADMPYRIIVMENGYFYTDNLFMLDSRGYRLQETDYQCIAINREVMDAVKKTACAVILITNPDVSDLIRVDAQMVGGKFTKVNQAIIEMAANVILTTNRKLYWKDITDKPDAFKPNGHLHALWELFGFTQQTGSLKRITTALDKITAREFDGLFQEFLIEFTPINNALTDIENRLTTHINDRLDPHDITAVQVGLQNVVNSVPATQSDAQSNTNINRTSYTTPLRTKQMIDTSFTPLLTGHINDVNNPHRDTAAKLGTLTNLEFRLLANQYYNRGETTQSATRIGSRDYQTYFNYVRTNVPVNQIRSGVFPQTSYAQNAAAGGHILQPTTNGYMAWRPFTQAVDKFIKKGNQILYAGTWGNNSANQATAWLGRVLGVGHEAGTIAVFKMTRGWSIETSNGSHTTTVAAAAMAVMQGGRWVIPGSVEPGR